MKQSEKQRIEKYLLRLIEGKYFQVEDLMMLTVDDLLQETPIIDIERSLIRVVLEEFKKKYRDGVFEETDF